MTQAAQSALFEPPSRWMVLPKSTGVPESVRREALEARGRPFFQLHLRRAIGADVLGGACYLGSWIYLSLWSAVMLLICAASNGQNLELARRLQVIAGELGISCSLLDMTSLDLPLFTPRVEADQGAPAGIDAIAAQFDSARAFVFCAPEYNGSIPPVQTNLIAWLSRTSSDFRGLFNGKRVALASHSGGHAQKVLMAMRIQLSHLGCVVLGRDLAINKNKALRDGSARAVLSQLHAGS